MSATLARRAEPEPYPESYPPPPVPDGSRQGRVVPFPALRPLDPSHPPPSPDLEVLLLTEAELFGPEPLEPFRVYRLDRSMNMRSFRTLLDRLDQLQRPLHRVELLEGVVYVSPRAQEDHALTIANIMMSVVGLARRKGLGQVYSEFSVKLDGTTELVPDVFFRTEAQSVYTKKKFHAGPAAWVVEVLSPGTRLYDQEVKRRKYLQAGMHEVWLVDLDYRTVTLYRRDAPEEPIHFTHGKSVLKTACLPGWSIKLEDLFDPQFVYEDPELLAERDRAAIEAREARTRVKEEQRCTELAIRDLLGAARALRRERSQNRRTAQAVEEERQTRAQAQAAVEQERAERERAQVLAQEAARQLEQERAERSRAQVLAQEPARQVEQAKLERAATLTQLADLEARLSEYQTLLLAQGTPPLH